MYLVKNVVLVAQNNTSFCATTKSSESLNVLSLTISTFTPTPHYSSTVLLSYEYSSSYFVWP